MIKFLYWRGRIQVAVMDVFHTLMSRSLISSAGLLQPIAIGEYHLEVQTGWKPPKEVTTNSNLQSMGPRAWLC